MTDRELLAMALAYLNQYPYSFKDMIERIEAHFKKAEGLKDGGGE